MIEKTLVANIWGDFHPGLFANPHDYLLNKQGWDSKTFTSALILKGGDVASQIYPWTTKTLKEVHPGVLKKVFLKLQEEHYWKSYNNWIYNHPEFKHAQLIHAHFGQIGIRLLPLLKRTGLPLVVSFYGVDGSRLLKEEKWVKGYLEMFPYTKAAIVLCDEVKERLMNLGLSESKIKTWRIPIELDTYKYKPRVFKEEVRFIIAARFVEKKGYPFLLEAFERLVKEGEKVKLTIVGYGPEKYKVEKDIEGRQLKPFIKLIDTGLGSNFADLYYNELLDSDIFILPSITAKTGDDEGGPALTLVAAQAAGLPVICTPFPGAEMSVINGQTGLYCEFNDADSIYKKMIYLMKHPEKWNELGKSGSDFVSRAFASQPQMEEMVTIYKEILCKN